jgi:hypothetical protein
MRLRRVQETRRGRAPPHRGQCEAVTASSAEGRHQSGLVRHHYGSVEELLANARATARLIVISAPCWNLRSSSWRGHGVSGGSRTGYPKIGSSSGVGWNRPDASSDRRRSRSVVRRYHGRIRSAMKRYVDRKGRSTSKRWWRSSPRSTRIMLERLSGVDRVHAALF